MALTQVQKGLLGTAIGGIFGGLSGSGDTQGSQGYTGGIPDLTASRSVVPGVFGSTYTTPTGELAARRPGSSGRNYFTDVVYAPVTDEAGLPTIKGAAEFEAANQAALVRQQELTDLGTGLMGVYNQKITSDQQAAATAAAQQAAEQQAAQTTAQTQLDATQAAAALQAQNQQAQLDAFNAAKLAALNSQADAYNAAEIARREYYDSQASGLDGSGSAGPAVVDGAGPAVDGAGPAVDGAGPAVDGATTTTSTDTAAAGPAPAGPLPDGVTLSAPPSKLDELKEILSAPPTSPFASIKRDNDYTLSDVGAVANIINNTPSTVGDAAEYFGIPKDEVQAIINSYNANPFGSIPRANEYTQYEIGSAAQLISQNPSLVDQAAAHFNFTPDQVRGYVKYYEDNPNQFAQGGDVNGYYLGGTTDGMADQIPATIDNNQPAALSDGEFVIPADVVSHLGNGNSDAGAKNLYSMMDRIRTDRTGNPNQGRQIDPNKYLA